VYEPIEDLEEINTKCRIHLTKLLDVRHSIRANAPPPESTVWAGRGGAFFAAFDPWNTCLRLPPGAFRYFDMAERAGLVQTSEAVLLSKSLLAHGAELAAVYDGQFRWFFEEPRIKTILSQVQELEHLSLSGLAVGTSWADRLTESCPMPLIPEKHLESQSFQKVILTRNIDYYAQTPWLAWMEALDLVSLGPWLGLHADEIICLLDYLRQLVSKKTPFPIKIRERVLGEKIAIPFFSNGLQGIVFGFFYNADDAQKDLMHTTLMQFGQTLADAYSGLRMQRLTAVLKDDLPLESLGREILHIVSPVKKLILSRERGRTGYALSKEHNYWAGYRTLVAAGDFERDPYSVGFTVDGPHGVVIYIEPLMDAPNFHHQFTHIRIEMCLRQCFSGVAGRHADALSNEHLSELQSELSAVMGEQTVSLAKLRQFYVISRVRSHWEMGRVNITNFEMKQFLEGKLGKEVRNGYQVTSYVSEVERMFDGRVDIRKTRNSLSIAWSPSE
jgi:hypothetical protein